MHKRAVTVTFPILGDNVLLLPWDSLLRLNGVLLRADMLRLHHSKLLLHLATLLGNNVRRDHIFSSTLVYISVASRELAVLWHADRVLVQRGLEEELAILNADRRTAINVWVLETGLGSCDRVLCCRVTDVRAQGARRLV